MPSFSQAQQSFPLKNTDKTTIKEEYSTEHWQKALAEERAAEERRKNNPEPYRGPGRAADYSDPFDGVAIIKALFSIVILSGIFLGIYRFALRRKEKMFEVWLIGILLFSIAVGSQRIILYFTSNSEEIVLHLIILSGLPLFFLLPQAWLFKWISLRRPFVLSFLMSLIWMTPTIIFIVFAVIANALRG